MRRRKRKKKKRGACFDVSAELVCEPKPAVTYTQRVAAAFCCVLVFYDFIHSGHTRKASDVDPAERFQMAETAVAYAVDMQRAMLALIGTHRRRTYSHDFVYGLHMLYRLFSKPWNAATEGNEHAHQDMKFFFAHLTCHSSKQSCDTMQVLRLLTVAQHMKQKWAHTVLPNTKYACMRAHIPQLNADIKEYAQDEKMAATLVSVNKLL